MSSLTQNFNLVLIEESDFLSFTPMNTNANILDSLLSQMKSKTDMVDDINENLGETSAKANENRTLINSHTTQFGEVSRRLLSLEDSNHEYKNDKYFKNGDNDVTFNTRNYTFVLTPTYERIVAGQELTEIGTRAKISIAKTTLGLLSTDTITDKVFCKSAELFTNQTSAVPSLDFVKNWSLNRVKQNDINTNMIDIEMTTNSTTNPVANFKMIVDLIVVG